MSRARILPAGRTQHKSNPHLFRLRQPMTPVLPVGERKLRHVSVLWAAVRQAAACHYAAMYRRRDQSTRVSEKLFAGDEGCAVVSAATSSFLCLCRNRAICPLSAEVFKSS